VTGLACLDAGSALSYLIAAAMPALDALIPALPSETAVIMLGVATAGSTDPRIGMLVALAALGAFLGDNAAYLLGRRFSPAIGKRLFRGARGQRRRAWTERSLNRFGARLIIVCRFIPGGRTAVTLTCGAVGYPRRSFIPATAAAGVLWASYAFFLGRLGGRVFADQPWIGLLLAFGVALAFSVLIEAVRRALRWRRRVRRVARDERPDRRVRRGGTRLPGAADPAAGAPRAPLDLRAGPGGGVAMPVARRRWRAWLTALAAGLAGIAALVLGRGAGGSAHPAAAAAGASGGSAVMTRSAAASGPALPATVTVRPAAAGASAIRRGGRPPMFLPGWRAWLESRWRERLITVTELALAYHDAAERRGDGHQVTGQAAEAALRRLMQEAVAARRALADTEDALARLSAGRFGQCEQCAATIPAADLARSPETRYCQACAGFAPVA
jgi:membrane protein DedA with SNARE-associated domain/RNA polymerase-binding transcription factor DksA